MSEEISLKLSSLLHVPVLSYPKMHSEIALKDLEKKRLSVDQRILSRWLFSAGWVCTGRTLSQESS